MESTSFSFDDEGWEDMPVIKEDNFADGLDEEDQKKFHYVKPTTKSTVNATGNLIDFDDEGYEWREKVEQNENEYTRLRVTEEEEADEVHMRTKYLFDEDKAMTPLSQMQTTKNLLTEAQRIAYVGVCALASQEMVNALRMVRSKELKPAIQSLELWALKIMGRLYFHMELETAEQKMIESLGGHGVQAMDLVPALMTTHTVANPEYDPAEARKLAESRTEDLSTSFALHGQDEQVPATPITASGRHVQTTKNVLDLGNQVSIPGVSTTLSTTEKDVTLDIRWTVLCDLFLLLIADSVYDARSRVLLENVASKLGLGWLDVVKFEQRVTEALEIQEGVEKLEQKEVIEGRQKAAKRKRYVMMGLATLGGGLVIGLSAGLLAPVIGAGLGAAFTTIGISGTTGFLAGTGGAAVITTGGVLTGSSIAGRGMARRTRQVTTFELLPLHNNKRLNCIVTVPGFMTSIKDDVRLPFSVLDPIVGDVFSVLWEPQMMGETGNALKILTSEVLSQIGQTVLQATVMTALMSALQWPVLLTKLGYLIDNPWSNALDRAKSAGNVLADVLMHRSLGVRPITLVGFSLGARVIFFALVELAKHKAMGIVQDVFLLGGTFTASNRTWHEARSVVAGRFVNCYAKNDWILNYLFRATSAGLHTVAGLRPVEGVPGLENVDVTDKIAGHMSYRSFMPLIMDQLGFPVSADYFDEPEELEMIEERAIVRQEDQTKKKKWFGRDSKNASVQNFSRPPSGASGVGASSIKTKAPTSRSQPLDDDLPPRLSFDKHDSPGGPLSPPQSPAPLSIQGAGSPTESTSALPARAGFDFAAIKAVINEESHDITTDAMPSVQHGRIGDVEPPRIRPTSYRTESLPSSVPHSPALRPSPLLETDTPTPLGTVTPLPSTSAVDATADLRSTFSRSMSLGDLHAPANNSNLSMVPTEEDELDEGGLGNAYRYQATQALSFGSTDDSIWAPQPPSLESEPFGDRMASSPNTTASSAHAPYSSSPFGSTALASSTLSPPPFSLPFGYSNADLGLPPSPRMTNGSSVSLSFGGNDGSFSGQSFGSSSSATTGLSFAGADGSIFASSARSERAAPQDPWSIPGTSSKKTPSSTSLPSANPWS